MLIVDGQIHLWEKGGPSPPHRQEPFSAAQAIAAMDEAGVDRALIHLVLWDPQSNELRSKRCGNTPTGSPSWGGSISTTGMVATSSRIGKSGRACSACAFISTSGTS